MTFGTKLFQACFLQCLDDFMEPTNKNWTYSTGVVVHWSQQSLGKLLFSIVSHVSVELWLWLYYTDTDTDTCFLPPYFNLRLLEDSQFRTWLQAQTGSHLWWFRKGNILEHGIHSDLHGPHPKWVTTIFIIFSRCTWHLQNLHVNCLFWMESHSQPSPKNGTSPIKILQIQVGWE